MWQPTLLLGETRVLPDRVLVAIDRASIPICPDGSLPWSQQSGRDGWSARTFLHQMLSTSQPGWSPSDTLSLLSRLTLAISQVRAGVASSCSDALHATPPEQSSGLYLSAQSVIGLARRALKRKRPLQRVLLRTPCGWRRKTLIVSSQARGFVFSLGTRPRPCKDSPEAGLLDWLNERVGCSTAMPSASPKLSS
jgi:hypothetical protein